VASKKTAIVTGASQGIGEGGEALQESDALSGEEMWSAMNGNNKPAIKPSAPNHASAIDSFCRAVHKRCQQFVHAWAPREIRALPSPQRKKFSFAGLLRG
jgi:hypothetical protein